MSASAIPRLQLPVLPALSIQTVHSPRSIGSLEELKLHFTVTNNSNETITLVRDPSGILNPKFRTQKFLITTPDGKRAKTHFKGIKIKWSPEKAAELGDTLVLGPGKSTHSAIEQDLSRSYDFSGPGEGSYTFTPKNSFYIVDPVSREIKVVRAESVPAVAVKISGVLVLPDSAPSVQARKHVTKFQGVEFVGGTPDQHALVLDVIQSAQDYITNCNRYLEVAPTSTPHYDTWFGEYDEGLMDTVASIYKKINGGPMKARYDITTCTDPSVYAWVNSDDNTRTIHLCPLFWGAPLIGMNSQAGTIVHELTHFNYHDKEDPTWDWIYGVVGCRTLAISTRHLAVNNADSFEYFAEIMGSNTASGLFFSNQGSFSGIFAIPENPSPMTFTGTIREALPQFNTPNVAIVYDDIKDLTGSYTIQAGSIVRKKKIDLRLKNEAGKELRILANLSADVNTDSQLTGSGSWN